MEADWPVAALWIGTGGAAVGYVLLFLLARSRVSLRPGRIACLLGGAATVRALLLGLGYPLTTTVDVALAGTVTAAVLLLASLRRAWLLRVSAEDFREQIETACRGLFLEVREPKPGCWVLTSRGEHELWLVSLTHRMQALQLCRVQGPGKVPLLFHWLSRQYPGPMPRIRITLKGGHP